MEYRPPAKRVNTCKWPGCEAPLPYSGRGRPPEYCPEHAKENTRLNQKRPGGGHKRKQYPQCCLDAQAAKVRASGTETIRYPDWREEPFYEIYTHVVRVGSAHIKAANVRVCAQHQDWRASARLARREFLAKQAEAIAEENDDEIAEGKQTGAFRFSMHHPDNYLVRDPAKDIEGPGVISGYDAEVEAMTRRYLFLSPDRQGRIKSEAMNEPLPPLDIGYWRDKCAEGRRWHTSEAFRYSPEMNRGAEWCAK